MCGKGPRPGPLEPQRPERMARVEVTSMTEAERNVHLAKHMYEEERYIEAGRLLALGQAGETPGTLIILHVLKLLLLCVCKIAVDFVLPHRRLLL